MDLENSICLIGPIGVGKSLFAESLSKKSHIPVISMDDFKHLPKLNELEKWRRDLSTCPYHYSEYKVNKLFELRQKYKKKKNYADFGYSQEVEKDLVNSYGTGARDFYNKQFENMLLEEMKQKIEGKVIFEISAGVPINFDEDFNAIKNQMLEREPEKFEKYFPNSNYIGSEQTEKLFSDLKNKLYLQLPKNEKNYGNASIREKGTNTRLINTKQYEKLSTVKVSTDNFFEQKKINKSEIDKSAELIYSQINSQGNQINSEKENKPNEPKKPSFLRRFFTAIIDIFTLRGLFKLIFRKRHQDKNIEKSSDISSESSKTTVSKEEIEAAREESLSSDKTTAENENNSKDNENSQEEDMEEEKSNSNQEQEKDSTENESNESQDEDEKQEDEPQMGE